jgi:Holliday junction resolvase RusA-like endonuclease
MSWPPPTGVCVGSFVVFGRPRPAGSKAGFVPRRGDGSIVTRNGKPVVVQKDSSGEQGEAWRQDVAAMGMGIRPPDGPYDCPLAVELTFVLVRPKGHYGTGRNAHFLKGSAPAYPTGKPDTGKLSRAVHDALTTCLYRDDALIVETRERKSFAKRDEPEHCRVKVWRLPEVAAALDTVQLALA